MKKYLKLTKDIDNGRIINRAIESSSDGTVLVFPEGVYSIDTPIVQNKRLHWEGKDGTELYLRGVNTILSLSGGGSHKSIIESVKFSGAYSIYDGREYGIPGIAISALVDFRHCTIRNFWGNGVTVSADINSGKGNASFSTFYNLIISECAGHGMYFQGGDANSCDCYSVDVRDCNGLGFYDNSFLGCNFFGCKTHANKVGSFRAGNIDDLNNNNQRSNFFGCYCEQGQGDDIVHLCGSSAWYGGMWHWIKLYNWAKVFSVGAAERILS